MTDIEMNTYSLVARCAATNQIGVAVATAMPAVGSNGAWIRSGIGAIASQSWVNPYLGIDGLAALASGMHADATLETVLAQDPRREYRQLGVVDATGRVAAFTGDQCTEAAGHITGTGFVVMGNMLTGTDVLDAMADEFQAAEGDLAERLMRGLLAGTRMGGDRRGKQSAALRVYGCEEYPLIDVRVDEHREPVPELSRVLSVVRSQLTPFVAMFPTRTNPGGTFNAETWHRISLSPERR